MTKSKVRAIYDAMWGAGNTLQIDSYATGRVLVESHIGRSGVNLELTDGSHSWKIEIPFPKGWNP